MKGERERERENESIGTQQNDNVARARRCAPPHARGRYPERSGAFWVTFWTVVFIGLLMNYSVYVAVQYSSATSLAVTGCMKNVAVACGFYLVWDGRALRTGTHVSSLPDRFRHDWVGRGAFRSPHECSLVSSRLLSSHVDSPARSTHYYLPPPPLKDYVFSWPNFASQNLSILASIAYAYFKHKEKQRAGTSRHSGGSSNGTKGEAELASLRRKQRGNSQKGGGGGQSSNSTATTYSSVPQLDELHDDDVLGEDFRAMTRSTSGTVDEGEAV